MNGSHDYLDDDGVAHTVVDERFRLGFGCSHLNNQNKKW